MRRIASLICVAALVMTIIGCSPDKYKDDRGWGDAPAAQVEDKPVKVWPSPDRFMNVGAFCIGEDAVYIHTRLAAPVVVGDSLNCDEDGVLFQGGGIPDAEVVTPEEFEENFEG